MNITVDDFDKMPMGEADRFAYWLRAHFAIEPEDSIWVNAGEQDGEAYVSVLDVQETTHTRCKTYIVVKTPIRFHF